MHRLTVYGSLNFCRERGIPRSFWRNRVCFLKTILKFLFFQIGLCFLFATGTGSRLLSAAAFWKGRGRSISIPAIYLSIRKAKLFLRFLRRLRRSEKKKRLFFAKAIWMLSPFTKQVLPMPSLLWALL